MIMPKKNDIILNINDKNNYGDYPLLCHVLLNN